MNWRDARLRQPYQQVRAWRGRAVGPTRAQPISNLSAIYQG